MKATAAGYQRFSIQEIKRINNDAGYYFFSPDTLRFFGNRMSDFRVVHVDIDKGIQEIYITAHNHNTPSGYGPGPVSVYRFNPANGDISHVDLSVDAVRFMRRYHVSLERYQAYINECQR